MNSTLGTVERVTSAIRHDLADVITDEDKNLAVRGVAAVGYGAYTAIGWTSYAAKTSTDAVIGGVGAVFKIFK
jgi:hypothetical protein